MTVTTSSVAAVTEALDCIEASQSSLNAFRIVRRAAALAEARGWDADVYAALETLVDSSLLEQDDVVDAAWKEMIKGGPFVILPWTSRLNKVLGGVLPVKLRDGFLNLVGVYHSMEEFTGRDKK